MQPKHFQFGGGAAGTILHPLVAAGVLIAIVLILVLPRNKAITPFLLAFFTIPLGQVLVLGGVHLMMQQILILTVLVRMFAFPGSKQRFAGGFNPLDGVVVLWALSAFVIFSLRWMEMQAIIKSLGDLVGSLGGYLAVRFLIPERAAFRRTLKALAAICIIQGAFMLSEQLTRQNALGFLGALSPEIRDGHVRSQGGLGNLYAGALAGVSVPLFLWLWTEKRSRMAACAGLAGATAIVFATYASTSWTTYGASLLALGFWPLRQRMRLIRWGIVGILVGLHLVMHGPVWSLIEKIDLTGGSSSFHRYMLVDNCIRHFGDWWLLGSKNYGDWGFVMFDVCNQFILTALRGGLVSLVIYVAIYKRCFGSIGKARKRVAGDRKQEWFLWCLGSALFATVVSSFGIYYIIYLLVFLFCLVAGTSVATFESGRGRSEAPVKAHFESAPEDLFAAQ
ncbi:MAG: hypothetical protein WA254_06820 [Candidatus Sulfotelmatobacter sp.]